ncbi:MAG: sulfatase-like hydrolase/transferase [Planctomycetota bacterium]
MRAAVLLALPLALSFGSSGTEPANEAPNVLFILCDDLGWGDLGVLFQNDVEGPKRLFTPHLDRMAAEGAVLRRHYCPAAVCAPSRASLLTGLHQGHATIRDNQFDKALEDNHTLATVLRAAGYRTALIGKYGLQGKGDSAATWPAYPTKRGFDEFYGYVRHRDGHSHYPAHQTRARKKMQVWDGEREVSADLEGCYTTDLFTARAKRYLVEHAEREDGAPFFLMLTYDTPHAALHVPTQAYPEDAGVDGGIQWAGEPGAMINTASGVIDSWIDPRVRDTDWGNGAKRFATMVHRIDDCVGDLLQTLRDLGMAENTLVVFSSDNGPHKEAYTKGVRYNASEFNSFGPFDGIKRDAWEGGIRVPTLAWWPGTVPAGLVDTTPSQSHDWMPTFAELAGVPAPARTDGVSLVRSMTGAGDRRGSTVYVEYKGGGKSPNYAEFDESHRARKRGQEQVVFLDGLKGIRVDVESHADRFEIYDVEHDPREAENLADSSPELVALERRMRDRVLRLRRPNPSAPRPYDNEPVPPIVLEGSAERGLDLEEYRGRWPWLPDFDALEPAHRRAVDRIDAAAHVAFDEPAGLRYTGVLAVPETGVWTFELASDAGAQLRLHDALVIDDDFVRSGAPVRGTIRLEKGAHPIELSYRTDGRAPRLALRWAFGGEGLEAIPSWAFARTGGR